VGEEVEELPGEAAAVERAFGVANRRRILSEYFAAAGAVNPTDAWKHVYRLLLWINPTISLAHCYESDKCQPHKAWYPRSLAFHAWVSAELGVAPDALRHHVDHLFQAALPALARVEAETQNAAAARHLERYSGTSMPLPGDDPDLVDLILSTLDVDPVALTAEQGRALVERVHTHFARENKRKNLLGRGFEDTLAAVIEQLPGHERWEVHARVPLGEIPGFLPQGENLKRAEVDLALWEKGRPTGRRVLVSAKWSVRADRERQFESDLDDYSKSSAGGPFDYVLITNEFDAARLDAACTRPRGNQYLFTDVVHVQPDGVLIAYGTEAELSPPTATGSGSRRKARQLPQHIASGRLTSLEAWLGRTIV
jgi:hypothetical protein